MVSVRTKLRKYCIKQGSTAEQRVHSSGRALALRDAAALTTQLAGWLKKRSGLRWKPDVATQRLSRPDRYSGRSSRSSISGKRATFTVANQPAVRLPTASECIATLERKT